MAKAKRSQKTIAKSDRHGWISTEKVKTRLGTFEFKNGYPTLAAANALLDQIKFNRAIEVYLTQIPAVGIIEERRDLREFGATRSNQIIIWETLMDAKTLVLTMAQPSLRHRPKCSASRWIGYGAFWWTLAHSGRTRARAESIYSCLRTTRMKRQRATSS